MRRSMRRFSYALLLLGTPVIALAQNCAGTLSVERSSNRCYELSYTYTTVIANHCDAVIEVYIRSAGGLETQQILPANETQRIYDCSSPAEITGWCYLADSEKCRQKDQRRSAASVSDSEQILNVYGRILATADALGAEGISDAILAPYVDNARNIIESYQRPGALRAMLDIDSELQLIRDDVLGFQLAGLGEAVRPSLAHSSQQARPQDRELLVPFQGKWAAIESKPRCGVITELTMDSIAGEAQSDDPRVSVSVINDGRKVLETHYSAFEIRPGSVNLGRGGTLSISGNRLLWEKQGQGVRQYVRCS